MSVKILLVDDSRQVRAVRSCIEQNTEWMVSEDENGKIALAMVADLKPQLVILELSMPEMNGLETARRFSPVCR